MADEELVAKSSEIKWAAPTAFVKLAADTPVIFADGIANQVRGPGISKFHFYRQDAVMGDGKSFQKVEVLQVIMPAAGFVDMIAFFEHRLRTMVKHGIVTQEQIDERRKYYDAYPVE